MQSSPLKPTTKPNNPLPFATQTPPNSTRLLRNPPSTARKLLDFKDQSGGIVKMDEKCEMLCDFFDCLYTSVRLLRLKGSKCSFTNISSKIQSLTDRRFTYRHLAQLNYVMPEVIESKRVLVFDEITCCMKSDLHVSVNVDAIEFDEESKSLPKNMQLRNLFRTRLSDFVVTHPQGDEVPESSLPEPFNHSKSALKTESKEHLSEFSPLSGTDVGQVNESSSSEPLTESNKFAMPSHFARSFRKCFSPKVAVNKDESSSQNTPIVHQSYLSAPESYHRETSTTSGNTVGTELSPHLAENEMSVPLPSFGGTPIKDTNRENAKDDSAAVWSTPAKLSSISSPKLMPTTPAVPNQKRCYMTPDDNSASSNNKLVRRATRTRALKFQDSDDDDDILKILNGTVLQSIREKEKLGKEEHDPAISHAKRRRQMISCLPKLFNIIHFLFQSMQKSVITKEELLHKIIAGYLDIDNRREVENQLNLLLELVPEWISESMASTGDFLLRINKMSNAETIRAQLEGAK